MWGFLISQRHCATGVQFSGGFPFHQQGQPAGCLCQFGFLPCYDIRQILHRAGEVGDLFFEIGDIGHNARLHRLFAFEKGR